MPTLWQPKTTLKAQITNVTIAGTLAGETFIISIGGVEMCRTTDTTTVAATTRAALVVAFNLCTHPYATGITAADGAAGLLTLTADTAGVPFVITLNTPGGSATFGQAVAQANQSPNDASVLENWSTGILPATGEDVVIPKGSPAILWGLAAITDVLDDVEIEDGHYGIGLPAETFATGANAQGITSHVEGYKEYRTTHLTLKCTDCFVGRTASNVTNSPPGTTRCKLDLSTTACRFYCFRSAPQTGDHPCLQIKANSASTIINNYGASLGVAEDTASDTSTVLTIYNYDHTSHTKIGGGVTVTTVDSGYGVGLLYSNPTNLVIGKDSKVTLFKTGTIAVKRGAGQHATQGANVAFTSVE